MADEQTPATTTASSTPPTDPEHALATVAQLHEVQAQLVEVQAQLRQVNDLVIEHADAMGKLHDETRELVEAVSKDVALLDRRTAQLEARFNDAMVRLGVDAAPPPPAAAPAEPGDSDLVFDGAGWVPKAKAAEEPPTS